MTTIFKLDEITNSEFNDLDRNKTIFFVTVSPIENHGKHNPLGMDLIESEGINDLICDKFKEEFEDWNIVRCPNLTMGSGAFPGVGSISIRPIIIKEFLIDYLSSFAKQGFKYIFISGFHGSVRHLSAIEEAIEYVNKKYNSKIISPFGYVFTRVIAGKRDLEDKELNKLFRDNRFDVHGGRFETSIVLYLRPDLIKEFSNLPSSNLELKQPIQSIKKLFKAFREYGYLGDPSKANKELGEKILNETVETFYKIIKTNVEEDNYHKKIRNISWDNPLVKTNFNNRLISFLLISISSYIFFKIYKSNKN